MLRFIVSIYQFGEFLTSRYVLATDATTALKLAFVLYGGVDLSLTVRNVPSTQNGAL